MVTTLILGITFSVGDGVGGELDESLISISPKERSLAELTTLFGVWLCIPFLRYMVWSLLTWMSAVFCNDTLRSMKKCKTGI